MLDLIYIPTGRITRLPDAEATRIYNQNKEQYRIIGCGFEEKEPVTVDKKTVAELIMPKEEEEDENELQEQEEKVQVKKNKKPLEEYTFAELRALCQSLSLSGKGTREVLYNRIKEELDKE